MGRVSDLDIELRQESLQESFGGLWLGYGDGPEGGAELAPSDGGFPLSIKELAHGCRDDLRAIAKASIVGGKERVNAGDQAILQGQTGPTVSHKAGEEPPEKDSLAVVVRWCHPKAYASGGSPVVVPQGTRASMSLSESSHAVGPAFEPMDAQPGHGGSAKADKASPRVRHRAPGSTSYGDCRHCPRSLRLEPNGTVPQHAVPDERGELRRLAPICQGSGEAPVSYLDSFDSELLEA